MMKYTNLVRKMIKESVLKENLESDIKIFIKNNLNDIKNMIDHDDWDLVYSLLEDNFPNYDQDEIQTIFNKLLPY